MSSSTDDVHHMMEENSASFHSKRGNMSRGPRQTEHRIKSKWLQHNWNQPSYSGIKSSQLYKWITKTMQDYAIASGNQREEVDVSDTNAGVICKQPIQYPRDESILQIEVSRDQDFLR
ncbi:unnamed protein product, partial [Protopolystoma xenopodis]